MRPYKRVLWEIYGIEDMPREESSYTDKELARIDQQERRLFAKLGNKSPRQFRSEWKALCKDGNDNFDAL